MINFCLSNAAIERINYLKTPKKKYFRISVNGGGCSGFSYNFLFTDHKNSDDNIFTNGSIEVLIDSVSQKFLNNAKLDFIRELGSSYFKISNPNAIQKCGCGNSFTI